MTPQAFIFVGRYGAGKGTQAELLIKQLREQNPEHPPLYIQTGQEFRNFSKRTTYTAALTKKTIDGGSLMPEFMCVYLWATLIGDNYTGTEHMVFDGTPRKLLEAKLLDGLFPFYGLGKPYVIYLDVEHEESHKRLLLRAKTSGRADDHAAAMEVRKVAYESDVIPTIEWYRAHPGVTFLDIDGERSVEEIHADIAKRIGLS
ncbi:MAG: adk, adenylate kinase, adenylate kinase [Candidatus Parcubacteria bacterium]|nr:adk, adenylate kinase, adenylate kinase [Candidatus Parcubacteria bacterium]